MSYVVLSLQYSCWFPHCSLVCPSSGACALAHTRQGLFVDLFGWHLGMHISLDVAPPQSSQLHPRCCFLKHLQFPSSLCYRPHVLLHHLTFCLTFTCLQLQHSVTLSWLPSSPPCSLLSPCLLLLLPLLPLRPSLYSCLMLSWVWTNWEMTTGWNGLRTWKCSSWAFRQTGSLPGSLKWARPSSTKLLLPISRSLHSSTPKQWQSSGWAVVTTSWKWNSTI
jgi:hypothetical protein